MKRILTATDFSPASDNALLYSVELAGIFKCPVTIVHAVFTQVLEPLTPDFYVEPILTDQIEIAEKKLAQLRDHFISKNISVDTVTETGLPSDVISRVSDNTDADIVSVGSKGDNLVSYLAGNTATDLVTSTIKPLLVIPSDVKFHPFVCNQLKIR
jgi:nucleotide-binding universal stress UspA family protein